MGYVLFQLVDECYQWLERQGESDLTTIITFRLDDEQLEELLELVKILDKNKSEVIRLALKLLYELTRKDLSFEEKKKVLESVAKLSR